ncbi:MAG TPA: hypothetical protein VFV11_05390 [Solimonas sp.]|nr:hypothetical protein [Solimonas sp.]
MKKLFGLGLLAATLIAPGMAHAALIGPLPSNGCELAAWLGFVNVKECE